MKPINRFYKPRKVFLEELPLKLRIELTMQEIFQTEVT